MPYKNKADRLAYQRRYYDRHLEKYRAEGRARYHDNRNDYAAARSTRLKEYLQTEEGKAWNKVRSASRRANTKSTPDVKRFYEDCPAGYHVDHIMPLALGGTHTLDNLQWLCARLNSSKKDLHPDDWPDPRPIGCRP